VKLTYWPPLILLLLGGAFYFNGRMNQEQPSKITPSTTSPQSEAPAKNKKDTDQEQTSSPQQGVTAQDKKETNQEKPPSKQQELPAKDKTEAEAYKLF
jgi:hypothetical protein